MFFNPVSAPSIEHKYYDRGLDAGHDFTEATLTVDNAWHDLDLSSIVPVGTVAVLMKSELTDAAFGCVVRYTITGIAGTYNCSRVHAPVTGGYGGGDSWVGVDGDRKIQYRASPAGIDSLKVYVAAWIK